MDAGSLKRSLKNIFTVAKWELYRPTKSKFTLISLVVLIASMVALPLTLSNLSFEPGEMLIVGLYHLYKIGTNDRGLAAQLSAFAEFDVMYTADANEGYDVYLKKTGSIINFYVAETEKGYSALNALKTNLEKLNNREIDRTVNENESMRYLLRPVLIKLAYVEQMPVKQETIERIGEIKKAIETSSGEVARQNEDEGKRIVENLTASNKVSEVKPEELALPFPFRNIFISFILIAPSFFFSMFFASALLREKVKRRGEVILSMPIRNFEILLGKMLPYLMLATLISGTASFFVGEFSIFVLITVFILTLVLFSVTSLVVLLTRSPESSNFILIFVYLGFFAYLFYPLMFAGIKTPDISMLSPLTAMTKAELMGASKFLEILYPSIFLSGILFIFSAALFKDDVLFTERSAADKISDIFEFAYLEKLPNIASALSGAVVFPAIFIIEIFLLFLLFPLGSKFLIIVLPLMVIIEEFAKVFGIKSLVLKGKITNGLIPRHVFRNRIFHRRKTCCVLGNGKHNACRAGTFDG